MGVAAGPPHVAARPAPPSPPRPLCAQWRHVGGWAGAAPDPPPRPPPAPRAIHKAQRSQQRAGGRTPARGFSTFPPPLPSARAQPLPCSRGSVGEEARAGHCSRLREEQEIVGPPRWACPGSSCLRKRQPRPAASWPRVAGRTGTERPPAPVGGWVGGCKGTGEPGRDARPGRGPAAR